jgi:hypothetical protein
MSKTSPSTMALAARLMRITIIVLFSSLLALAAVASVAQSILKNFLKLGVIGWGALLIYAVAIAVLVRFGTRPRTHACERKLAGWILGVTFLLKLGLVVAWSDLSQGGDRLSLLQFADRWASGGDVALRQLSRTVYDYPLHVSRISVLLYPLRILFSTRFVLATQVLNCVLSTAILASIYGLCRRLVTRPLLPLVLAALSPAFSWSVLDYGDTTYRFQGALLLLATLALGRFIPPVSESARWRAPLLSVFLGLTLFLLHLQQGLDLVVVALLLVSLLFSAWQQPRRQLFRLALLTLILPVAIMLPLSKAADNWIAQRDDGKLNSGFIGHLAIGWNLVTWGEFYGPLVTLDLQTPPDQKKEVMLGYIKKQIREHPFNALVRLPLVKGIKLFQLGANSGAEGQFEKAGQARWAAIVRATRLVFAPVVLLLAALGSCRFLRLARPESMTWILLVLDFTTAYVLFSEVSPVYSIYFQFVLLVCAAEGILTLSDLSSAPRQWKISLSSDHCNQ